MKIKGEYPGFPLSGEFPDWEFELAVGDLCEQTGVSVVVKRLFALHARKMPAASSPFGVPVMASVINAIFPPIDVVVYGDDNQVVYHELRDQLLFEEEVFQ